MYVYMYKCLYICIQIYIHKDEYIYLYILQDTSMIENLEFYVYIYIYTYLL
jgi:hypothetical protein